MTTLVWFRRDLRLTDNPAVHAALADGGPMLAVYVHAPEEEGDWAPGGASRWWLHHSLAALAAELERLGSRLCLRAGRDSLATLLELARASGARRVLWNRLYEPSALRRDRHVKAGLRAAGLEAESFNGALLHEPWTVRNRAAEPFQVFTAFWRHCRTLPDPPAPTAPPGALAPPPRFPGSESLDGLALLPRLGWAAGIARSWTPGSGAAQAALGRFLQEGFADYADARDRPGVIGTSRLSPHLHFGEIGPRQVWHALRRGADAGELPRTWRDSQYLAELGWREFAHHLLYHFPHTAEAPLRPAYARFPWREDGAGLRAWQRGLTGYPIVDAGLRELWHTGWMHNRVRMIAASFLVKDLLISWRAGARWFWDTLVDADLASNTLGWQWVAGCGADAAPYFRIFNPVSQGDRFDAQGGYVRRWLPELAGLPDAWLMQPWAAAPAVLQAAGVTLGQTYPQPCVEHAAARQRALEALASLKAPSASH